MDLDPEARRLALRTEAGQLVGQLLDTMATKDTIIATQAQEIDELKKLLAETGD